VQIIVICSREPLPTSPKGEEKKPLPASPRGRRRNEKKLLIEN